MARYLLNEKTHQLELIDSYGYKDPNKGLNGPVYCPEGGYYDMVLNKTFSNKQEKRNYMREKGLKMEGNDRPVDKRGVVYFYNK